MCMIFYVCDRKSCNDHCNPECSHTNKIEHAANFELVSNGAYFEKKDNKQFLHESIYIGGSMKLDNFLKESIRDGYKFSFLSRPELGMVEIWIANIFTDERSWSSVPLYTFSDEDKLINVLKDLIEKQKERD